MINRHVIYGLLSALHFVPIFVKSAAIIILILILPVSCVFKNGKPIDQTPPAKTPVFSLLRSEDICSQTKTTGAYLSTRNQFLIRCEHSHLLNPLIFLEDGDTIPYISGNRPNSNGGKSYVSSVNIKPDSIIIDTFSFWILNKPYPPGRTVHYKVYERSPNPKYKGTPNELSTPFEFTVTNQSSTSPEVVYQSICEGNNCGFTWAQGGSSMYLNGTLWYIDKPFVFEWETRNASRVILTVGNKVITDMNFTPCSSSGRIKTPVPLTVHLSNALPTINILTLKIYNEQGRIFQREYKVQARWPTNSCLPSPYQFTVDCNGHISQWYVYACSCEDAYKTVKFQNSNCIVSPCR